MELNIRAGARILYKNGNSGWLIGTVQKTESAEVNEKGVWIPVQPINNEEEIHFAEINNIFTDCTLIEDWMRPGLLTKKEYIDIIQSDNFEKNLEHAWVSDGEYAYYYVSKYTENWIMKQPFDYILRGA